MALPLIPLVAGAVLGGLAAYLYKDEKLRRDIKRAADNVTDKVSDGFDGLRDKVSGRREAATADDDVVVTKPKARKKTAKKKVSTKKAAAKKSVRRKAPAREKASPSAESQAASETPADND